MPPTNIPGPPAGKPITGNLTVPHSRLDGVKYQPNNKKKAVPHDPTLTFVDAYNAIIGATEHGPGNSGWNATIEGIKGVLQDALIGLGSGLKGQLANALNSNLTRSFGVLHDMSEHARKMEFLVESFFDDLATTKSNFEQYAPTYNQAIEHPSDPASKETLNQLNGLVVDVMNVYRGPIDDIAMSHPSVDSAVPEVGPPTSGPIGSGGGAPGVSGGGAPGVLPQGGLNTGDRPTTAQAGQPENADAPSTAGAPTGGSGDAGNADQAQKGSSQAGDAGGATGPGDALKRDGNGVVLPPAGMLGLGTRGLSGVPKLGGGAVGRGGGGAGRGLVGAKPPTSVPAAPRLAASSAPVSRAGVSGVGQGAAGAPVAGHQGSAADKTHKVNKALRLPKNGEEVVGEAEAVTPVIGQAPKKAAPSDSRT